jgi:hypothetical protein
MKEPSDWREAVPTWDPCRPPAPAEYATRFDRFPAQESWHALSCKE